MRPSAPRRVIEVALALIFAAFAAVQYNDPDPLEWMALYGAAMGVCGWDALREAPRWAPISVAAVATPWAAWLGVRVARGEGPLSFGVGQGMLTQRVEETRELGGLVIVAVTMAALAVAVARRPAPAAGQAERSG